MKHFSVISFKAHIILIIFLALSVMLQAQSFQPMSAKKQSSRGIEISGMYGYQFGGKLSAYKGDLSIMDSGNWGVTISIPVQYGMRAEIAFYRQDSHLNIRYYAGGYTERLFDMAVEYYQIGGVKELRAGKVTPYGIFTAGAVRFAPKSGLYDDEWKFAVTLGLGAKINLNNRFGLRVQGTMLMPIMWAGGSLWCGTGGCSAGISTGSVVIQGNILGGIFIRI